MSQNRSLEQGRLVGFFLCLMVAAYFLSIVVYTLMNYERYAAATPQLLRYVVAPGLIAIFFCLAGVFLRWRQSVIVGSCGLVILLPLFLFEAFLTVRTLPVHFAALGQLSEEQKAALESESNMVRGFTLGSLNRRAGVETLAESILSGFPRARVVLCSPAEGVIVYSSDRLGFNNPDSVYDSPIDVVVLGDSFIEGFCLPPGKDVVSQLRSRDLNAVSAGIRGNGPLLELATLGRYGPTLKPRHVVMAFFAGNDWRNFGFELTEPWLRTALQPGADFGPANGPVSSINRAREIMDEVTKKSVTTTDLFRRTPLLRNYFALHLTGRSLGLIYPKV
ncbi:MAG: SGNH/GDSL hydrolase family protein, partial [Hyphomicrobiales bacterium]|nr:SGNH/GDSL hydrolase family protein [Hyphomicrobiales bacterium]